MSGSEEEEFQDDDEDYDRDDEEVDRDRAERDEAAAVAFRAEVSDSLKKMGKVVNNLMARADCVPFREPVDWKGLQLYDYPKIITKMMDLGTVKKRLEKGKYPDATACAEDIRLVWHNCMTYNADGSDFYRLAESYSRRFEERYQKLEDEFGEAVMCGDINAALGKGGKKSGGGKKGGRQSRSNSFASSGRNTPVPGAGGATSSSAATSRAERSANNADEYDDTSGIVPLDVRTRFAARLQRLSGMELGHVVQTIDMNCPEVLEDPRPDQLRSDAPPPIKRHRYAWDEFDGGRQLEIDVDAIPVDTFRKLDSYVKEKVAGRGRGPWSDDLGDLENVAGGSGAAAAGAGGGGGGKRRKIRSF